MLLVFFITWALLSLAYGVLILCYRLLWKRVPLFVSAKKNAAPVFITVIIPARNEEKHVGTLLKALDLQTYDKTCYEIILVDDHSSDKTASIARESGVSNLRIIPLKDYLQGDRIISYKKKAIETAISLAKGELIVTTDADCIAPEQWLETIADYYHEKSPKMIVMPVKIDADHGWLQKFQALDFLMLQGITAGSVHRGLHSMSNGANLAYTKEVFKAVKGFEGIDTVASGDDMLLMEKIKEKHPDGIAYLLSEKVIVKTRPAEGLRSFLQQRIRWAGKTKAYREKTILPVLLLVYVFNLMMVAGLVVTLNMNPVSLSSKHVIPCMVIWLLIMGWKIILERTLLNPVAMFFGEQKKSRAFLFFQPLHILYTVLAGTFGMWGKTEWKGRSIR